MNSTLIYKKGNRSTLRIVAASEPGTCVVCHHSISIGDRVVVRSSGKPEHAYPQACLSTLTPIRVGGHRVAVGYWKDEITGVVGLVWRYVSEHLEYPAFIVNMKEAA